VASVCGHRENLPLLLLDSGLRRNDGRKRFSTAEGPVIP
jgi:hypothetical protein